MQGTKTVEHHVGQFTIDPAAETEMTLFCTESGFKVVDPKEGRKKEADILIQGEAFSERAVQHGEDDIEGFSLALVEIGGTGFGRHQRRNAFVEELGARRGFRVAGAQPSRNRADVALEQMAGICRGQPATLPGDANGGYVELVAIDGPENRRGRQQRDLMLTAAPAEKNAHAKFFCHFPVLSPRAHSTRPIVSVEPPADALFHGSKGG